MIRPATASDAAQIRACARLAYTRYVPLIGPEPAPMNADFDAQIAAGEVIVAEDGGFAGFVVFRTAQDHVLLENVAVMPAAAGRGVGRTLIACAESEARARGLPVRLYTNARMTENLSIYPRLGYIETGRRREDGFDRVYFEKRL